ncbi:hypothetical protein VNO80_06740 [Phaseolus coccineus]|uniref:Uncharacterized protein n=1 Tax=Phaseolus coccineus TaxID=3886 RepID=A0AAN9RJ83_PHACN
MRASPGRERHADIAMARGMRASPGRDIESPIEASEVGEPYDGQLSPAVRRGLSCSKKGWAEVRLPREETGDSWHLWLLRAIQLLAAYESRKLNRAERPYAVHEKELRGRPAIKLSKER